MRVSVQDLPQKFGEAYGAIAQYLGELGEQPSGPPFAAYHNMDMQNLDVEIGFPVSKKLTDRGDIQAGEIPGGKMATCLYIGPYGEIEPAYDALSQWMKENGYEATGVAYEMYLNDPQQTPPQELQTQIVFPLK
jgi:effector-binding domain-containing protein